MISFLGGQPEHRQTFQLGLSDLSDPPRGCPCESDWDLKDTQFKVALWGEVLGSSLGDGGDGDDGDGDGDVVVMMMVMVMMMVVMVVVVILLWSNKAGRY